MSKFIFMSKALVVVPTYNEIENIERLVLRILSLRPGFHILVVDDNSPDGTAGVVRTKMEEYPDRVFLLEREEKTGLGTAYIAGFKWALARDYEYVFEMDG